jgi:hypothetical protein
VVEHLFQKALLATELLTQVEVEPLVLPKAHQRLEQVGLVLS